MFARLCPRACPLSLKTSYSPAKEEGKERRGAFVVVRLGTLWRIVQISPNPRTKRREGEKKFNPTPPLKLGMTLKVRRKPNTRGATTSNH